MTKSLGEYCVICDLHVCFGSISYLVQVLFSFLILVIIHCHTLSYTKTKGNNIEPQHTY